MSKKLKMFVSMIDVLVLRLLQQVKKMTLGLMHREHLDSNSGMLFIFPSNRKHSFWMKNTLISLDIIWMDHTRQIVHIEKNVPPCKTDPCPRYTTSKEALYVLELNAGESERSGIQEGDRFEFNLDQIKS